MSRRARKLLTAPLLALAASCVTYHDYEAVHLSSTPPGAMVLVDGVASGFSTPCKIALDKREQVITLEKPGYAPAARRLVPDPYNDTWFWSEASVGPHTYDFPLWINLDQFVTPVERRNELEPARIHVHLKRLADL
ncbi:MAG: PEGA domain-containing protein [Planctomycetes bacterium]|nr:PEGA domain-containing protein [Planctomycetota bacterium]